MMAFASASRNEISSSNSLPQPQSMALSIVITPSTTSESLLRSAERLMLILTRRRSTKKSTCGSLEASSDPRPGIAGSLCEKGAKRAFQFGVTKIVPRGNELCRKNARAGGERLGGHLFAEY